MAEGRYYGGAVVHPDMLKERQSASFNVELLTNLLDGGRDKTERKRAVIERALKEKVFTEGPPDSFLAREDLYDRAVRKAFHMVQLRKEWRLTSEEYNWLRMVATPSASSPADLHDGMFWHTMETQTTDEQKAVWMPKVESRQFMGTYAQTELGHGTNVRRLETTATFDPATDEFVLHSPKLSSMKWWPGALGKTSNCAVVMAQLYSNDTHHGMQPFFVIFRDLNTHEPLPGITVGDIGPKLGYSTMDNGFLRFDHFRIPRTNMLMRNAEVRRDGVMVPKTKLRKPVYMTMTASRIIISQEAGYVAQAAAVTIAVRYSAIRRQSELQPGGQEPQVLDYQTQQYKLFPHLASAYAYKFACERLSKLVDELGQASSTDRENELIAELHALSSGLKATSSSDCLAAIEEVRLACGGHGFSSASGLPGLFCNTAPSATYEGENSVLLLQQARYLMKCVQQSANREHLAPSVSFLGKQGPAKSTLDGNFRLTALLEAFEHRARRIISDTAQALRRETASGRAEYDARNHSGVFLVRAALAHSRVYVLSAFVEAAQSISDTAISRVMTKLCQLFALNQIVKESGDFLHDGYLTPDQLRMARTKEMSLLGDIRPDAVPLVDAFDFPDVYLGSALGRYDGQVYDSLYEWARGSPLNKAQVHPSYYKYIQPSIKANI